VGPDFAVFSVPRMSFASLGWVCRRSGHTWVSVYEHSAKSVGM